MHYLFAYNFLIHVITKKKKKWQNDCNVEIEMANILIIEII